MTREYPQYRAGTGKAVQLPDLRPLEQLFDSERLTQEQVSAYIGYSVRTIRAWRWASAYAGFKGPAYHPPARPGPGRRGYYLAGDVKAFLADRAREKAGTGLQSAPAPAVLACSSDQSHRA